MNKLNAFTDNSLNNICKKYISCKKRLGNPWVDGVSNEKMSLTKFLKNYNNNNKILLNLRNKCF